LEKLALFSSERMTYVCICSVLTLAIEVSAPTPILEQANGVVFKEHPINKKIDSKGISVAVAADRHLKGNSRLQRKMRHELSQ
jgi:hypothetical protein